MNYTEKQISELEKRIDNLEFKQRLLFDNDSISRLLFEYNITEKQCREIMDLMEEYRNKIKDHEDVNHSAFEEAIYTIVPEHASDYHMCEYLAKEFMANKRWEEVFMALYSGCIFRPANSICTVISTQLHGG